MMFNSIDLLHLAVCLVCLTRIEADEKLVFVQAIWRHGDRAPLKHPFPNDQYDERAWPRGWGQLTNLGIQQLNELGRFFRKRYGEFVGKNYVAKEVYIQSSASDRTLTSAQAFAYGFYPAENNFQWENGSRWQPVPVHASTPGAPDLLLQPLLTMTQKQCPNYYRLLEADLEEEDSNTENYAELIDSLEEEMGYPSFEYHHIGGVYDIHRELIHNMTDKQPEFVFKTWPQYGNRSTMELVEELERSRTMVQFNSAQKAKMVGGFLLNNFIEYALMVERLENKREKTKLRKMVLYSSHDGTLLSLMYAMNVANGLLTPCAAAIIMEIYKKDKEYFVEFWYRNETTNEPYPLSIPKCGSNCTVQKFAEQYSNIRVKSWNEHQELCWTSSTSHTPLEHGKNIPPVVCECENTSVIHTCENTSSLNTSSIVHACENTLSLIRNSSLLVLSVSFSVTVLIVMNLVQA